MEEETRKQAILRYVNGESPKSIYTDLTRSKYWFFKWLKRFRSGDLAWYQDRPKVPLRSPTKTSESLRQMIISMRKQLESEPFAQVGVSAVKWELNKLGIDFPSDSTINRILKKEGFVKKNFLLTQRRGVPLLQGAIWLQ